MRKLILLSVVMAAAIVACENSSPTGPAGVGPGGVIVTQTTTSTTSSIPTSTTTTTTTTTTTVAPTCSYTLAPGSATVVAAGGNGQVVVSTVAGCVWAAQSFSAWLTVTPDADKGPGALQWVAAPNTGIARTGTIVVGGVAFTVSQAAAGPVE